MNLYTISWRIDIEHCHLDGVSLERPIRIKADVRAESIEKAINYVIASIQVKVTDVELIS